MYSLLFVYLTILYIIAFSVSGKKLNVFENLFIFMVLEFLITSFSAILYVNLQVWDITGSLELFFVYRLYEVIVLPLLYLTYFNLLAAIRGRLWKVMFTFFSIAVIYGTELLLVKGEIIAYRDWSFWQSLIVISLVLFSTYILYRWFRRVLRKEGIG
ncbi:hypothetical protein F3157_10750 [Virgibacillus dakarensis]|uniref:Uncharacterized protein n=1 Tax=Lentibacillus populi TaxID=1827502 RepID=A0A9W5TYB5_9BACI|nr:MULTISPECIES: hypothetical protein [Bacillaceae]MTW86135.1 hypothetical protein [Virgibacillus dakarensis]GGB46412.1 hypothetical protein GCM10011409_24960 [Lentibacillus populi]